MKYSFVLLSGGVGSRMHNSIPKQYMLIAGKPMIMHILEKIDVIDEIESIIIVCSENYIANINLMLQQYGITKKVVYAPAGNTRQESVFSGLKCVKTENVIIHEAARPFVTIEDYRKIIDCKSENAIMGIDIPFTVAKGNNCITGLLNRSELINVQLPQKFNVKQLMNAHMKAIEDNMLFTEDSSLLLYYEPNINITIIKGQNYNLKITTRLDALFGEIIYDEIFRRVK